MILDALTAPLPLGSAARSQQAIADERKEIRGHYARLILSRVPDREAFERCDDAFGYVASIRALRASSPHAKKLNDEYWAKRRAASK